MTDMDLVLKIWFSVIFLTCFVCLLVVIAMLLVPTDAKNVEYWARVHADNQEKIHLDRQQAFLAQLEIPPQYRSKQSPDTPAPAKPLRAVDMTKGAPPASERRRGSSEG